MKKEIIPPCRARTLLAQIGAPIDHCYYATPNFSWQELLTKQFEAPTLEVLNNLLSCARVLEVYREKIFYNAPITITSGWRSHTYNEELKKRGYKPAKSSLHLQGLAVDFVVKGYNSQEVYSLLDPVHFGGMERDAKLDGLDWTHIDLRGHVIRISNLNWTTLAHHYSFDAHTKIF